MLRTQISTEIGNHNQKKSWFWKKYTLKKIGPKIWNPKLNIVTKLHLFFYINSQPFEVQRSLRPFWNKQKWQNRIMIICFNFWRNKNYVNKTSSRNSTSRKFHIKITSFVFIYHLYHLFEINYKGIFYNLNITLNLSFINKILGITLLENSLWVLGKLSIILWHIFFFIFLSSRNIWNYFLYFFTQMLQLL